MIRAGPGAPGASCVNITAKCNSDQQPMTKNDNTELESISLHLSVPVDDKKKL